MIVLMCAIKALPVLNPNQQTPNGSVLDEHHDFYKNLTRFKAKTPSFLVG